MPRAASQVPAVAVLAGVDAERGALLVPQDIGPALSLVTVAVRLLRCAVLAGTVTARRARRLTFSRSQVPIVAVITSVGDEISPVGLASEIRPFLCIVLRGVFCQGLTSFRTPAAFTLPAHIIPAGSIRLGQIRIPRGTVEGRHR